MDALVRWNVVHDLCAQLLAQIATERDVYAWIVDKYLDKCMG